MPISFDCPCGKALRVQDQLAGKKVKCPICGEILDVPTAAAPKDEVVFDEIAPEPRPPKTAAPLPPASSPSAQMPAQSVTGKAGCVAFGNILVPLLFGSTTLSIQGDRLIGDMKRAASTRHCEILLSRIDSAEIVVARSHLNLLLSLYLLTMSGSYSLQPLAIVGLLILPFYCFMTRRYLVIRSQSNAAVLVIKGPDNEHRVFLDAVLTAAAQAR